MVIGSGNVKPLAYQLIGVQLPNSVISVWQGAKGTLSTGALPNVHSW